MEDVDDKMDTDIEMKPVEEETMCMDELPEEYQDGAKNWQRLLDTLQDLNQRTEFPKDWAREQRRHIQIYTKVIPMFKMSRMMEDKKFQQLVNRIEQNIRILEEGLRNKQIILDAYGYFVQDLIEAMRMHWEMKNLCDLMCNL